ncbi:hypothetical protein SDC9_158315 [bioreactor metagenome]|uniref:Uncharacterized protein n=1 Tax=bioreactor metagenome TaxID=1076179 RepID=A0A645F9U5_9ZZZZ
MGGGHAKVFKPESHILAHHGGDDLVIRVLEHHAAALADLPGIFIIRRIHAADKDLAGRRRIQAVEQLGDRRLAGAVVTKQGHKLAPLDIQADIVNGELLALFIGKAQVLQADMGLTHCASPLLKAVAMSNCR